MATGRHVSRAIVRESFGQGRVVEADRALRLGMVDRIDTLEQVVGRRNTPQRTARAMGYRQRLAEAEKRGPRAAAAERRLMIAEVNQALN